MPKLTITQKLLIYLNPDDAHSSDIAMYLYGADNLDTRKNILYIIKAARRLGWQVECHGNHLYRLSKAHYMLVQTGILFGWIKNQKMTPQAVTNMLIRRERLKHFR